MKTLSRVSLTGPRGERRWRMFLHPRPRPRLPVGEEFSPVYIPVEEETFPSPNREIPREESGPHCHLYLGTCIP
jgi:hypothetical protein